MVDLFWSRWSKEYVSTLLARSKWRNSTPNLEVGHVVLIADESKVRDQWNWGMVESVKGDQAHIRSATIRLASGKVLERPCAKLVRLELDF